MIKWITASVYEHFKTELGAANLYIEFEERPTKPGEIFELRTAGPDKFIQNRSVKYEIAISISVKSKRFANNPYNIMSRVERVVDSFKPCINLYKYGDGGERFGYLQLVEDKILVTNLGMTDATSQIALTTAEAKYKYET